MKPAPFDPFSPKTAQDVRPGERVLEALRAELKFDSEPRTTKLGWVQRSRSRTERVIASLVVIVLLLLVCSPTALSAAPQPLLITAVIYGSIVGLVLFAGGIPGNMSLVTPNFRRAFAYFIPPIVLLVLAFSATHFSLLDEFISRPGLRAASSCLLHSLFLGTAGMAALLFIWRRSDPFSPRLTGALVGALGGLMGTLSMELGCASTEGSHLTISHGMVVLVLAFCGSRAGKKWLTP